MLPALRRGFTGTAVAASTGTSLSIDITSATAAEWVYAACAWRSTVSSPAISGWTAVGSLQAFGGGITNGALQLFRRRKVAGDTTFSLTWTTTAFAEVALVQWIGLDATTPDEGYTSQANTSANNVFTTAAATPGGTNRWGAGIFVGGSGQSGFKQITWTPSAPITEFGYVFNGNSSLEWVTTDICDTQAPVAVTSTTYTNTSSTGGTAVNNGITAIFFLIPAQTAFQPSPVLQAVNRTAVI